MMRRAAALLIVGAALAPVSASADVPPPEPMHARYFAGSVYGCGLHSKCSTMPGRAGYLERERGDHPTSTQLNMRVSAGNLARIAVFVSSARRVSISWKTSCKASPYDKPTLRSGTFTARGRVRHTIRGSSTGQCDIAVIAPIGHIYVEIDGYPGPLIYPPGFAP